MPHGALFILLSFEVPVGQWPWNRLDSTVGAGAISLGGHTHRVTFLWLGLSEFFQCPILRAVEFPTRPGLSACFGGRLSKPRNFRYLVADACAEAGPLEVLCAG